MNKFKELYQIVQNWIGLGKHGSSFIQEYVEMHLQGNFNFINSNLFGSNLKKAILNNTNFTNTNLRRVDFRGSNLEDAINLESIISN